MKSTAHTAVAVPRSNLVATLPPLLFPFTLLVLAWAPTTRARFGMIDDHQIVQMLHGRRRLPLSEVVPQLVSHRTEPLGRFRPLYWVGQVLESAWAGDQPIIWYVDRLLLAAVTLAALLHVCRTFVGNWFAAVIAPTALLGPQFEAWARLGAAEVYAMPSFCVGLALMLHGWRSVCLRSTLLGVAAIVASALAKENLLPFAAAGLLASLVALRRAQPRRLHWLALAGLAAVFAADIAVLTRQLALYGSQYSQERNADQFLFWARFAVGDAVVFQAAGAALVLAIVARARGELRSKMSLGLLSAGLAAIVLQIAFYTGAETAGRYLLPGTVAVITLWLAVMRTEEDARPGHTRAFMITATVLLGLSLLLGTALSVEISRSNTHATREFQSWLSHVEQVIVDDHATVVVIQPRDPTLDAERMISTARYLQAADFDVDVMTTPTSDPPRDESGWALARQVREMSIRGTPDGLLTPLRLDNDCISITLERAQPVCPRAVSGPGR